MHAFVRVETGSGHPGHIFPTGRPGLTVQLEYFDCSVLRLRTVEIVELHASHFHKIIYTFQ